VEFKLGIWRNIMRMNYILLTAVPSLITMTTRSVPKLPTEKILLQPSGRVTIDLN
jgi:hypothetical protein